MPLMGSSGRCKLPQDRSSVLFIPFPALPSANDDQKNSNSHLSAMYARHNAAEPPPSTSPLPKISFALEKCPASRGERHEYSAHGRSCRRPRQPATARAQAWVILTSSTSVIAALLPRATAACMTSHAAEELPSAMSASVQ